TATSSTLSGAHPKGNSRATRASVAASGSTRTATTRSTPRQYGNGGSSASATDVASLDTARGFHGRRGSEASTMRWWGQARGQGQPGQIGRLAERPERQMAEALVRKRPEMARVARERLAAVGDRARVILCQVSDGGALVPALGKRRRLLDQPREDRPGRGQIA